MTSTVLTNVRTIEDFANSGSDKVDSIWVPFTVRRTLTVCQLYNLRVSASAAFESKRWHT